MGPWNAVRSPVGSDVGAMSLARNLPPGRGASVHRSVYADSLVYPRPLSEIWAATALGRREHGPPCLAGLEMSGGVDCGTRALAIGELP